MGKHRRIESKSTQQKEEPKRLLVEVSFVFVDPLKKGIEGLEVKIESDDISHTGTTDKNGVAISVVDAKRNMPIRVYIKKKSGSYELKWTTTPKNDVNVYTIKSPELHFTATTKKSPKEEAEEEIVIPKIKVGEVLTAERLFGELAPFIGGAQVITEVGKITKDFPTKKTVKNTETGKEEELIEHHYKIIKTEKPNTVILNLLASRLNYPKILEISDDLIRSMAKEFKCEFAAIKAVTYTEASGIAYYKNGLPKILFERHHFYDLTNPNKNLKKGEKKKPHPYAKFSDICNPTGGGMGQKVIINMLNSCEQQLLIEMLQ